MRQSLIDGRFSRSLLVVRISLRISMQIDGRGGLVGNCKLPHVLMRTNGQRINSLLEDGNFKNDFT